MKLFYSPASPYARKCRVVALEKGLHDGIEIVTAAPLENPAALHAANPLGKVPALVLADGLCIVDSPVICGYLDSLNDSPRLIPLSGAERFDVLTREAIADGIQDAALSIVFERRRPESERSSSWQDRWAAAIHRAVAHSAACIMPRAQPDLGDIALACALAYLDLRLPDLAWDAKAPGLRAWLTAIEKRPSLAATAPPPA